MDFGLVGFVEEISDFLVVELLCLLGAVLEGDDFAIADAHLFEGVDDAVLGHGFEVLVVDFAGEVLGVVVQKVVFGASVEVVHAVGNFLAETVVVLVGRLELVFSDRRLRGRKRRIEHH